MKCMLIMRDYYINLNFTISTLNIRTVTLLCREDPDQNAMVQHLIRAALFSNKFGKNPFKGTCTRFNQSKIF